MTYTPYRISPLVVTAVEFRVLPLRRFVKDTLLWWWIMFWMWALDPLTAMNRIPWVAGCLGYYDARDTCDYPQISRFYSMRRARWRNSIKAEEKAA